MEVKHLVFHAPGGVMDKDTLPPAERVAQVRERIELGFVPNIILRKELSRETFDELSGLLRQDMVPEAGLDFGQIEGKPEDYLARIDQASELRDDTGTDIKTIGVKLGSAIPYGPEYTGINSTFPPLVFSKALGANIDLLRGIAEIAQQRGFAIEIENRPRPNYGKFPNGAESGAPIDTAPRWGGAQSPWSAFAQFIGTVGSSVKELAYITSQVPNTQLQLDLDHLTQTCQFGRVLNLENTVDGRLYGQDIPQAERDSLEACGVDCSDGRQIFDYSGLDNTEHTFLDVLGFAIREGQPLVYAQPITLKTELEALAAADVKVGSITPGFQVDMGIRDTLPDGTGRLVIGSHMPGIVPEYISDPGVRDRLSTEIAKAHKLCWDFMDHMGIRDVEVEYQVDNGATLVYGGPAWKSQFEEGIRQLKENFEAARE